MDRFQLIDSLADVIPRPISAGLDTAWLRNLQAAVSSKDEQRIKSALLLVGEQDKGYSVYKIRFSDGNAYVGMTGNLIIERMKQHFIGAKTTESIMKHVETGIGYTFSSLISGLSQSEALVAEKIHIAALQNPMNVVDTKGEEDVLEQAGALLTQLFKILGFKVCYGCHQLLPANSNVFAPAKTISGIGPRCKTCVRKRRK